MPKVSIIVPVYNAEKVISRCVDSILYQDYHSFELILVDDGSTDGSASILDQYAKMDARVHVIHKKNTGVSDTRNTALKVAKGKYIQFADADDWLVPEATSALVHAAEESGAGMVISDFYRVVGNRTSHKGSIEEEGLISREEYAEFMARSPADYYYGVLWNKLFVSSIIEENNLRMDENLQWCEDFIFDMEYILHVDSVYVLRVPLYYYVKTEGSLISKGMNMADIVRMKLNVIDYYTQFYKNIYNEADYAAKRASIYGFLLDFAHDDGAIPGLPGTKKLGTERTRAAQDAIMEDLWTQHYYEGRLLERNLRNVALQTDLDLKDIRTLLFLQHFGSIEEIKEIAEYVGTNQLGMIAILEKLALKKLIVMDQPKPGTARLAEQAGRILKLLENAFRGTVAGYREALNPAEREEYERLRSAVSEKIRQRLMY